jgi:hypothetical protein
MLSLDEDPSLSWDQDSSESYSEAETSSTVPSLNSGLIYSSFFFVYSGFGVLIPWLRNLYRQLAIEFDDTLVYLLSVLTSKGG